MSYNSYDPTAGFRDTMVEHWQQQRETAERLAGRFDAADMFNHLKRRISHFQSTLPEDKEIGVQLANFGIAAEIHIRSIGFKDPNIIEFKGILSDGREVLLMQHISQLNFLLTAISPPKEEEPYRIGFRSD